MLWSDSRSVGTSRAPIQSTTTACLEAMSPLASSVKSNATVVGGSIVSGAASLQIHVMRTQDRDTSPRVSLADGYAAKPTALFDLQVNHLLPTIDTSDCVVKLKHNTCGQKRLRVAHLGRHGAFFVGPRRHDLRHETISGHARTGASDLSDACGRVARSRSSFYGRGNRQPKARAESAVARDGISTTAP